MRHKTTRTIVLVSLLILIIATMRLGYAYDMPNTPDQRLTWSRDSDWMPSIAQARDGKIWVAWHSYRTGNADIFYKVYDASREHPWSSDTRLTTDPNADLTPSIMRTSDGTLWVAWSSNRSGDFNIVYTVYDGGSWSPDHTLTTDPNRDDCPSIVQSLDGTIWVFWSSNRLGNSSIFYTISTDYGVTWSPDTLFPHSTGEENDRDPAIVQSLDGTIWVFWVRNNNILYTTSDDMGATWPYADEFLTMDTDNNIYPSVMQASDGSIWVAWSSDRYGNYDIFYKIYNGSWSFDKRLTNNIEDDFMSSIMEASDQSIWMVWTSSRLGNYDIYYRTTVPLEIHDVAIFSVTPSKAAVYQGQMVSIEVVAQNHGTYTQSETFEVSWYANYTLKDSETIELAPGQLYPLYFNWNTTEVATATYTISAQASPVSGESATADNTFTDGKVQVKIPGDVNGDEKVNVEDAVRLVKAWGKIPNPDPEADINGDGYVGIMDAATIVQNYG